MLEAIGLEKYFKRRAVVHNVSLQVDRGEIVGVLGPNGAGKTTLFQILAGLTYPVRGEVLMNGQSVTAIPLHRRARIGLSYLPQEPSVFRKMSVEDNIRAAVEMQIVNADEQTDRVNTLLSEFNLLSLAKNKASTLSGGERRRLEIARALVRYPQFLLLDEPFSGIDPIVIMEIQQILFRLKAQGIGIFMTDHNIQEILSVCDRTYILHGGEILFSGTPGEIVESPLAREVYLGRRFHLADQGTL
jgi:lipopolysaccharide export system ATP-binding protein